MATISPTSTDYEGPVTYRREEDLSLIEQHRQARYEVNRVAGRLARTEKSAYSDAIKIER